VQQQYPGSGFTAAITACDPSCKGFIVYAAAGCTEATAPISTTYDMHVAGKLLGCIFHA
jgi:hypothetical protein